MSQHIPGTSTGRTPRSSSLLPPRAAMGFAIAIVAVLALAYVTGKSLEARDTSVARLAHTTQVIDQVENLVSTLKDAETGQRGYLLTGEDSYLDPYERAKNSYRAELESLRRSTADDPDQRLQLDRLEAAATEKMDELGQTIALRRSGDSLAAVAVVRTDRGKAAMDRLRALVAEIGARQQGIFAARQEEWRKSATYSSIIVGGGSAILVVLIGAAASMTSRSHRAQEREAWLRAGRAEFGARILGEQRLDVLGRTTLAFLTEYLDAQIGAMYVVEDDGRFRMFAGHALPSGGEIERVRSGDGLLGQAAVEKRPLRVRDVPAGYLPISSSLGRSDPGELLITPIRAEGEVVALIELGFFRSVDAMDQEFLERVSEGLGASVRGSRDRLRLEALLEETQRQAEELQAQQEELRASNEELEEQSRALRDSQQRLEIQHVELEQTNAQLEEQAQVLERQKADLSGARSVLLEKAAELERSNAYKSEFLANMSHELRTPLNSSLILAKLLSENKQQNLTEEQVDFARTIHSAGNDLLLLINDILDLSRIESGQMQMEVGPVRVDGVVESVTKAHHQATVEKGLAFSVTVDAGTPAILDSDSRRLGQILHNLLSNAVKFTERGSVSLRVSAAPGGRIAFAVCDTGIGIAAHQQDIIFEPFRQADGSTQRKYGGTGLGLSISRDLARLLGGDLVVQSAAGEGSVFTLTLPVAHTASSEVTPKTVRPRGELPGAAGLTQSRAAEKAALAQSRAAGTAARDASPSGAPLDDDRDGLHAASRTILVVEDDPRFATILRDLARQMGFQCIVTHTANEGLAAASAHELCGVLLDVNLPDHSGLGVLDQLKRVPRTRHVPVHVVSVGDYAHEALERGAIGYALKPVKREELVEALRRIEAKVAQAVRRVLVVEDDERQRESVRQLLETGDVEVTGVANAADALERLRSTTFDCIVMDLNLPDLSGYEMLESMAAHDGVSFPPVIVYTGRALTRDEEHGLRRFARSIIVKDVRSPERLLDEVTLFLHQVESSLPPDRQQMLRVARARDAAIEGRRILIVEDDVRNVFALTRVLEPQGAKVVIARNGREAVTALERGSAPGGEAVDLVLMDIMMPEMDGLTAMREIRKRAEWQRLPIIALTAKAMRDDQLQCLAAGANDYIAKPLDVDRLLSLVRVWMPK